MSSAYDDAVGLAAGLAALPGEVVEAMLARDAAARPGDAALKALLAARLWHRGDGEAALRHMWEAAERRPGEAELQRAVARMLAALGAQADAAALRRVLAGRPAANANLSEARAEALLALGRPGTDLAAAQSLTDGAIFDRLQRARDDMLAGDLPGGLAGFAWRLRDPTCPGLAGRMPHGPTARPDPADWRGRTVLCFGELGHGDMIQCLRYVPMALAAGAQVVLELHPGLVRLARSIAGVRQVVGWGEAVPAHDMALPMFHLPWAFGTTVATVPAGVPYLWPQAGAAAAWRARLEGLPGLKVGLVWAGEKRAGTVHEEMDGRRSLDLAALGPLAAVAGVSFVSLQLGGAAAQAPPPGMALHDWTAELSDFADTAALMAGLDLVISVDTAPLHLAGALGQPVWLLNRHDTCWRWLREREDSPWYPTLRIFRQAAPGEWGPVVARVAEALRRRVS